MNLESLQLPSRLQDNLKKLGEYKPWCSPNSPKKSQYLLLNRKPVQEELWCIPSCETDASVLRDLLTLDFLTARLISRTLLSKLWRNFGLESLQLPSRLQDNLKNLGEYKPWCSCGSSATQIRQSTCKRKFRKRFPYILELGRSEFRLCEAGKHSQTSCKQP